MSRFQLYCYNTSIIYILVVLFSKSRANLLYLICVFFELFLYFLHKFCSLSLFNFILIFEDIQLIFYCVLDCFFPQSLSSNLPSSSESKSILFTLLFQNQNSNSLFVLFISSVLKLLSSI